MISSFAYASKDHCRVCMDDQCNPRAGASEESTVILWADATPAKPILSRGGGVRLQYAKVVQQTNQTPRDKETVE